MKRFGWALIDMLMPSFIIVSCALLLNGLFPRDVAVPLIVISSLVCAVLWGYFVTAGRGKDKA